MSDKPIKSREAPPRPAAMIESLRGLGYSTAGALADIIDNSISAKASKIDIKFFWQNKASYISVLDNGNGMDDGELELAMHLGEKNPLDSRESHDLGRFGLGLKTASFSQCRRLSVASKKHGQITCLRWDLDVLAASKTNSWMLLEGPAEGSEVLLHDLNTISSGTLVLWEILDRIVTPSFNEQSFLDLIDQVENHLGMVFHRFLDRTSPRIELTINGSPVAPWDPFLSGRFGTWSSPLVKIPSQSGVVKVQCHVLPHKDKLDPQLQEITAGPQGWTAQQGFYVYRNERLLVAGGWLGVGRNKPWTKEESFRLARIMIDIPNSADADWKIDIRKSTARPPSSIKEQLTRLAEDTRERARRVFAHRGQYILGGVKEPVVQAWKAEHLKSGMRYRIDLNHPALKAVIDDSESLLPQIKAMLRIIEETVPVQRIWLDTAESHETPLTGFNGTPSDEISAVLSVMYKNMIKRKGLSPTAAKESLLRTEPFNNYPDLVASLADEI